MRLSNSQLQSEEAVPVLFLTNFHHLESQTETTFCDEMEQLTTTAGRSCTSSDLDKFWSSVSLKLKSHSAMMEQWYTCIRQKAVSCKWWYMGVITYCLQYIITAKCQGYWTSKNVTVLTTLTHTFTPVTKQLCHNNNNSQFSSTSSADAYNVPTAPLKQWHAPTSVCTLNVP